MLARPRRSAMIYFANLRNTTMTIKEFAVQKKLLVSAILLALTAVLLNSQPAFAHESITIGNYEIVYGWVNEPPIAGQLNGVEIFINDTGGGGEQPAEEHIVHSLVAVLTYGGENKTLTLEPVFDVPGAFDATILPTIPGLYSLRLSGTLGDTPVDAEVELEEVQPEDAVQFPRGASTASTKPSTEAGTADWLVWLSLLLGLSAIGISVIALRTPR